MIHPWVVMARFKRAILKSGTAMSFDALGTSLKSGTALAVPVVHTIVKCSVLVDNIITNKLFHL